MGKESLRKDLQTKEPISGINNLKKHLMNHLILILKILGIFAKNKPTEGKKGITKEIPQKRENILKEFEQNEKEMKRFSGKFDFKTEVWMVIEGL